MFNNNHIAVHEVRYANSQENSLLVLFSDQREENPQVQEMEVEVRKGDAYYEALRELKYTPKKIKDQTANWKRAQSRELAYLVDQRVQVILQSKIKEINEKKIQLNNLIELHKNNIQEIESKKQKIKKDFKLRSDTLQEAYKKIDLKEVRIKEKQDLIKEKQDLIKEKENRIQFKQDTIRQKIDSIKEQEGLLKNKYIISQKALKEKEDNIKEERERIKKKVKLVQAEHKLVEEKRKDFSKRNQVINDKLKLVAEADKKFEKLYTTKVEEMIQDTFEKNNDPDQLFKFKIALFSIEEIKYCSKDMKNRLRKARSIIECYGLVNEIYQSNNT